MCQTWGAAQGRAGAPSGPALWKAPHRHVEYAHAAPPAAPAGAPAPRQADAALLPHWLIA